ncbi:MAG: hypothetical protein LBG15_01220 [Dysgonamonadaceae bacterium]|jgi:hypothetical protein|nr:hypothetical protein [Dysgonamonadaceae bacterium]
MTVKTNLTLGKTVNLDKEEGQEYRIDKNIAKSIDILWLDDLHLSNETKGIIKNLIFYICLQRQEQNNLFNEGVIEIAKFAKEMNYSETFLRMKEENPFEFRGKSPEEIKKRYEEEKNDPAKKVWDSKIENAMFILNKQPVQLRSGAERCVYDDNEKKAVRTSILESYILIKKTELTTVKSKKGLPTIVIRYNADDIFLANMSLLYNKFNKHSVLLLRRNNLDDLYIILKSFKDELRNNKNEGKTLDRSRNFNYLCQIAHISSTKKDGTPLDKRKIKDKLNKALKEINATTDLKFTVKWEKQNNTSTYRYLPYFYFDEVETLIPGIRMSFERKAEKRKIFKENLLHQLLPIFEKYNKEKNEDLLLKWLKNNQNEKEKDLAFRNAQYASFGKIPAFIDSMVTKWLASLPSLKSLDNITDTWEMENNRFGTK